MSYSRKRAHKRLSIVLGAACALSLAGAAVAGGPVQLQKIFPDNGPFKLGSVQFGAPVAVEGDTMAIGDFFFGGVAQGSGAVFIYERDEMGVWVQTAIVTPDDAEAEDSFGSLALNGDILVVGASQKIGENDRLWAGKAYVFERDTNGDWIQTAELLPTGAVDGGAGPPNFQTQGVQFGAGVAFDGETIAIGAPGDDELGNQSGAVFVFERNLEDEWEQTAKIVSFSNSGGFGGAPLAIDGDVIVAGGSGANTPSGILSGAGYICERNEMGGWDVELILPPAPFNFGSFGSSVAVSGDTALIGAINIGAALGQNDDPGSAFFYQRNEGTGDWELTQQVIDFSTKERAGDFYGAAVKIKGDVAAVGSLGSHGVEDHTGAAFMYHRDSKTGVWTETARITADDGQLGDSFAFVAFDGDTLAVGATAVENPEDSGAGAVYVFDLAGPAPSADLDGDGLVGSSDLAILLGSWGPCPADPAPCPADLDGDGAVGSSDLGILLAGWGPVD